MKVLMSGHDEDFQFSTLEIGPQGRFLPGDYGTWTRTTVARLAADGWDVRELWPLSATDNRTGEFQGDGFSVTAIRDGIFLEVESSATVGDTPPGSFEVSATLTRMTTGWLSALAWAG